MRGALALALTFLPLTAFAAGEEGLPRNLPGEIQERLRSLAPGRGSAELFLCAPYCERLGTFTGNQRFDPASPTVMEHWKNAGPAATLKLWVYEPGRSPNVPGTPVIAPVGATADSSLAATKSATDPKAKMAEPLAAGAPKASEGMRPYFGMHLDFLLGKNGLATAANTDTASAVQIHGILGGGVSAELPETFRFLSRSVATGLDLSYWSALDQKLQTATGQSLSTSAYRLLLSGILRRDGSAWDAGPLIEAYQRNDTVDSGTALLFSSKYLWASAGLAARYRGTTVQVLQSVFSTVQDADQYRGQSVSSSRLFVQVSSCLPLSPLLTGVFQICALASGAKINVRGEGTTLRPVFTQNPTYDYKEWALGIQLGASGVTF